MGLCEAIFMYKEKLKGPCLKAGIANIQLSS
jgi:hypothetical protein